MSYLRPTCSDAAARASNLHISRYLPSFRQGDTQSDHHVSTGARATYEDSERLQRLPSQRPLDRRWDESRGLIFAERSRALKNYTWTPRHGIVFAGSLDHQRNYATRPSRPGATGVSRPAGQVFGSGDLPSLEKPPTFAAAPVLKGAKQEQMEKDIRDKEAKIAELKQDMDRQVSAREARIAELRKQKQEVEMKYRNLQIKNEELRELFDQEKSKMYSDGRRDAEKEAKEEAARAVESQMLQLKAQGEDLGRQLGNIQAQLPALKESMERDVEAREIALAERTKEFEADIANRYGALNRFDDLVKQNARESKQAATDIAQKLDEVSRELQLKEDGMLRRKAERGSYDAYRAHYTQVHDERRILDDKLRIVQKQLSAEIDIAGEDRSQQGSSRDLKALEKDVADIRNKLAEVDEVAKTAGHTSRTLSASTRFRDISIAAEAMDASLYLMSINPLKSIKSLTNVEFEDIDAQMKNASNATLRKELKAKKDALSAQVSTLNTATNFAYLDRTIQVLRTLKTESYPHKASYMATIDLRNDLKDASTRAHAKRRSMSDLSYREWRRHRTALDKLGMLAKRQAQILEVAGQHEKHEKRLDVMIDEKIADVLKEVQAKRASLFGSHKSARYASRRAGLMCATPSPISSPVIRKTFWGSPHQPEIPDTRQYAEDCLLKAKLVAELRDPATTMDAQTRADKAKQYFTIHLRTVEHQIKRVDAKLMAKPRTRTESGMKSKYQQTLRELQESYARANRHLANGTIPSAFARVSKSKSDPDTSSKEQDDDATKATGSLSQFQLGRELSRLKNLKKSQPKGASVQATDFLNKQIQSLALTLGKAEVQSLLTRREALMSDRDANKTTIERLTVTLEQKQQVIQLIAAGFVTKTQRQSLTRRQRMSDRRISYDPFPDSNTTTPETNGLNMTPTPAKQTAHVSHMGLYFSHELSWNMARRQDQLTREIIRDTRSFMSSAQEQSSSAHAATFSDHGEHLVDRHDPGAVAAVSSEKCVGMNEMSDTSTSRKAASDDDDNAKSHIQPALASLSASTYSHPSTNNKLDPISNMAELEEETLPAYEIPLKDKRNALIASRNSTASFWKYSMYKNAAGEAPTRHYCTTFEQTEAQLAKFSGEKVVGFDLEWEKWKSKPGEDSAKRCVSLVQIASEDKVALFHLALFRGGDSTAELMPPALRSFLEDPEIIKVGVNIGGDASRLRRCFGVEMRGNIELSHLYKLVTYGETKPAKVNRGLYALANQVKDVLHLPLSKGEVRTSSWSKRLNDQQTEYAASDAYAGLRLFYELERRRRAMKSKPPRPAFHELGLPIMLGGDQTAPEEPQAVEATEEPLEESAALQEQNQDDDTFGIFDTPEDLEALDAYLESQDATTLGGSTTSLPEISYPTLPPLEEAALSEPSSPDSFSSLPSDPLTKPTRKPRTPKSFSAATTATPTFSSSEAATAEIWSNNWQSSLPATHDIRVNKQALRAYHVWHHQGFTLEETAALLRKEPLALSTVVTYIAEVLQKEGLDFDEVKVGEIRARLPISIRGRYGRVYASAAGEGESG